MPDAVDDLLLLRLGRGVVPPGTGAPPREDWLRALDLELAAVGHAPSYRLRAALGALDGEALPGLRRWLVETLGRSLGGGRAHEPLFRRFPHDVPAYTEVLWWRKFVGFYLQTADQPCLWCQGQGQTHVLSPCGHVVCDRCFDGSNYSACPVCERAVDRGSPFFRATVPPADAPPRARLRRPFFGDYVQTAEIGDRRFKVARLRRPTRRALLAWVDALPEATLVEDMLRHPSAWVAVGEALHLGEHAARFPRAARAFAAVRGAPHPPTFAARAEQLRAEGDSAALAAHLATHPGELWRRTDDTLRDARDPAPVVDALVAAAPRVPTPLLLTVATGLARRETPWPARVWFPKGAQFRGPVAPDRRPPLPGPVVATVKVARAVAFFPKVVLMSTMRVEKGASASAVASSTSAPVDISAAIAWAAK